MNISLEIIFKTVWIAYVFVVSRLDIVSTLPFCTVIIDFINSVKSVSNNFESIPDDINRDINLCGDSRFGTNENKLILESTISYIKNTEVFC